MPVVSVGGMQWNGSGILVPNPHCVVFVDDGETLDSLDLTTTPLVVPPSVFPDGVNVEFAVPVGHPGDRHVRMRVFERGVGETMSCGTGAVAVMVAAAARDAAPVETAYDVDVPGGCVRVTRRADQHLELRGPAVLVATIRLGG
jgi:diaminopimelate epimerase